MLFSYDFVNDASLDVDIAKIIDEIGQFAYASYIPIYIKLEDQDEVLLNKDGHNTFQYFVEEQGLEVSISVGHYFHDSHIYYRNQIVSNANLRWGFLEFQINILNGDAKEVLTLNRNEIQSDYFPKLRKKIMDAVFDVLSKHYNEFDVELKQYASMFIEYYSQGDEQRRSKFGGSLPNDWKGLKVPGLDNKTMEDCLNYKKIVVSYVDSLPRPSSPLEEQGDTLKIYYVYWKDLIAFVLYKTKNHKLKFISADIMWIVLNCLGENLRLSFMIGWNGFVRILGVINIVVVFQEV